MKSILTIAGLMLAVSGVAQAAASPKPTHMMGHSMKSGHMMSGHMKGSMKGDHMAGGHMMGHAKPSPSAMHGAMSAPSHTP